MFDVGDKIYAWAGHRWSTAVVTQDFDGNRIAFRFTGASGNEVGGVADVMSPEILTVDRYVRFRDGPDEHWERYRNKLYSTLEVREALWPVLVKPGEVYTG